jgi:hypothetical protein
LIDPKDLELGEAIARGGSGIVRRGALYSNSSAIDVGLKAQKLVN